MNHLTVSIASDNAAFDPDPGAELARILRNLADRIETGTPGRFTLHDVNGNRVGNASWDA